MSQYHLQIRDGDVAPYVLLPGDPGRVPTIAAHWAEARHLATNREYVTYTGVYQGVPISCTSGRTAAGLKTGFVARTLTLFGIMGVLVILAGNSATS